MNIDPPLRNEAGQRGRVLKASLSQILLRSDHLPIALSEEGWPLYLPPHSYTFLLILKNKSALLIAINLFSLILLLLL